MPCGTVTTIEERRAGNGEGRKEKMASELRLEKSVSYCGRAAAFALPVALALFSFGCSNTSSTPQEAPDASGAGEAATSSVTFTEVYTTIIEPDCSTSTCHNAANMENSALDMSSKATAYANLVSAPASGYLCSSSGLDRVAPGDPSTSLLYLKVSSSMPPCGFQMPPDATALKGYALDAGLAEPNLTAAQQTLISDWIKGGAHNN
jgi:hypothetical protein